MILEVLHPARRPVRNVTDLQQALSGVKSGEFVSLNVYNIGLKQTRVVNLRIGE